MAALCHIAGGPGKKNQAAKKSQVKVAGQGRRSRSEVLVPVRYVRPVERTLTTRSPELEGTDVWNTEPNGGYRRQHQINVAMATRIAAWAACTRAPVACVSRTPCAIGFE